MADIFTIPKIKKSLKVGKTSGHTDIYAIAEGVNFDKICIPMHGNFSLSPCVADHTTMSYVVYGASIKLMKTFDFVLSVSSGNEDDQMHFFALPKVLIESAWTKEDKQALNKFMLENQADSIRYFQMAYINEK
jgi:hypothetical protein